MDQICVVVPILPGRTADARDFMRELETGRNTDYQRSEQRIGIVKEAWYLAATPAGDQLVAYMESPDFPKAFLAFSQSRTAGASLLARGTLPDGRSGAIVGHHPEEPERAARRPNGAPAYYLGRPAHVWIAAMGPRSRRKPVAGTQNPAGQAQPGDGCDIASRLANADSRPTSRGR